MAAPNLVAPTNIKGRTASASLTTSAADVLVNASSSNKLLKVNIIRAANIGTNSSTTVTVVFRRSSTDFYLIKDAIVSVGSSLVVNDKNEYLYLEEGDSIRALASGASAIDLLLHYEEIV